MRCFLTRLQKCRHIYKINTTKNNLQRISWGFSHKTNINNNKICQQQLLKRERNFSKYNFSWEISFFSTSLKKDCRCAFFGSVIFLVLILLRFSRALEEVCSICLVGLGGQLPDAVTVYTIQHGAIYIIGTAQLRVHRNWRSCPYLNSIEKI